MNVGQYTSDLIRLANQLQKEAAGVKDPMKVYQTVTEIKDIAKEYQNLLVMEYLNAKG